MKKILIKNAHNTFNYGSMMMCENIITKFKNNLEDVMFYIEYVDKKNINRLVKATNYEEIYMCPFNTNKKIFKTGFFAKLEKRICKIFQDNFNYIKYDAVIVLGGDDYAETYYKTNKQLKIAYNEIKKIDKLSKKSDVYMIGQTIGPYTGERKEYASRVFNKVKVYTRDHHSLEYMKKELGIIAEESKDIAFLDLNLQSEFVQKEKEILNKYNLEKDKYITIVGTGLMSHYTNNIDDMCISFIELIKILKNRYPDYDVVWLSHVTTPKPAASDNTMLEKLLEKDKRYIEENVIIISEAILPVEARVILGGGYLTITCRMHAAVSTFQMGKPAICLSYSSKYKGVIADGLNMQELVIDCKQKDIWENCKVDQVILEKLEYTDLNYSNILKNIKSNVNECKKQIDSTLTEIITQIRESK